MHLSPAFVFLIQALLLIVGPFALWRAAGVRRVAPMVVVQILFGIALGPSLLGRVAPEVWGILFGGSALAPLTGLSWLAVVFFAFLTGLHLDVADMRGRGRAVGAVAVSSMVIPTLAGAGTGLWVADAFPAMAGPAATPALFAAGFGVCLGVTALPVLGAILREMGLTSTRLGALALACAAVNDALLWVALAALLGAATGGGEAVLLTLAGGAAIPAVLWGVVRPWLAARIGSQPPVLDDAHLIGICALLLLTAAVSEAVGLHYILGAFLAGTAIPKPLAAAVLARVESVTTLVLLPFFFTLTGLKVTVTADSPALWAVFLVATAVTIVTKLLGSAVPARLAGIPPYDAWRLGALMPCKGLMEVVVLTVLLEAGILSGAGFSALVLMAVAVTALTQPMTRLAARLAHGDTKTPLGRTAGFR